MTDPVYFFGAVCLWFACLELLAVYFLMNPPNDKNRRK